MHTEKLYIGSHLTYRHEQTGCDRDVRVGCIEGIFESILLALLALGLLSLMLADGGLGTVLAPRSDPAVLADGFSSAFLAVRPHPAMITDLRPTTVLALRPHHVMRTEYPATTLSTLCNPSVVYADG